MDGVGLVEKLSPSLYRIRFAAALYEREAVFAAAQRLNDRCYVKVEPAGSESHAVLIQCKDESDVGYIERRSLEFINEVLEEQVRLDLMKRTGALREVIYRHAFLPIEEQEPKP